MRKLRRANAGKPCLHHNLFEILHLFKKQFKTFEKQVVQGVCGFCEGVYIEVNDRAKTQARRRNTPLIGSLSSQPAAVDCKRKPVDVIRRGRR